MSKKLIVALLLVCLLLPIVAGLFMPQLSAAGQVYWASSQSNKFHYPSCRWAQKIHKDNLIIFKDRKEAVDAGYIPCKVCKP